MKTNKLLLAGVALAAVILVLAGCGKKENPYEPNSGAIQNTAGRFLFSPSWINITPGLGGLINDLDPGTAGTQGEIIIVFNNTPDMDPATVNLTNIVLGGGTVNNPEIKFYPELKKAVISGTFADAAWFTITMKPGLRTKAGMPIDGNGNGQFDGTPYDDFRYYVRTAGAPAAQEPNITNPTVTAWFPPHGNGYNSGAFAIIIQFDAGDFDTTSVRTNITITDSAGNAIPLQTALIAGNAMWFNGVAAGDTLKYDTKYIVTFKVNNMTDIGTNGADKNKATWGNYGYIANVPDLVVTFRTKPASASVDYVPLHYASHSGGVGSELVVTFDDSLDYSTINNSTVKIYRTDNAHTTIYEAVNCRIYYVPDDVAQKRFRVTTTNCSTGFYQLWISRFIKDNAGWYLDGNNDNFGGEAGDHLQGINSDDVKINF